MSGNIVIVTGLSGAGRTTALRAMEDLGFEAIDNLPIGLVESAVDQSDRDISDNRRIAIGIDTRTRDFEAQSVLDLIDRLKNTGKAVSLLFLDCSDAVLQRRFTATRRKHPMAGAPSVGDAIASEREALSALADRAALIIDTSELNVHDLRRELEAVFPMASALTPTVSIVSFSYARGLPREADLVFDARFLTNPHYDPALQDRTGLDKEVGDFIDRDPAFLDFLDRISDFVLTFLPLYRREGKAYLTVAIGCTGGRHRSVYAAQCLASKLPSGEFPVKIVHREL